ESFPRTRESLFGDGAVRAGNPVTEIPAFAGMTRWVLGTLVRVAPPSSGADCGGGASVVIPAQAGTHGAGRTSGGGGALGPAFAGVTDCGRGWPANGDS